MSVYGDVSTKRIDEAFNRADSNIYADSDSRISSSHEDKKTFLNFRMSSGLNIGEQKMSNQRKLI